MEAKDCLSTWSETGNECRIVPDRDLVSVRILAKSSALSKALTKESLMKGQFIKDVGRAQGNQQEMVQSPAAGDVREPKLPSRCEGRGAVTEPKAGTCLRTAS